MKNNINLFIESYPDYTSLQGLNMMLSRLNKKLSDLSTNETKEILHKFLSKENSSIGTVKSLETFTTHLISYLNWARAERREKK
ncbi:hypothetical protein [Alkaliphilus hydrothermalis]|uniref:Core-binding (CB) domain-containing protein n=1 Tax=Alkaliphilus hydrothermalis TaxID=1482730 RepID=A0ABS2NUQ8_9FIRM|nr:hypothetical protein [Alkaliphilus hydrothermalis]MBM7616314.1 hypothetical protein [Alkaliphilus hydrothermalis]